MAARVAALALALLLSGCSRHVRAPRAHYTPLDGPPRCTSRASLVWLDGALAAASVLAGGYLFYAGNELETNRGGFFDMDGGPFLAGGLVLA